MTPQELQEYIKHPVKGQITIDPIENLRRAGLLIRHHHERFDGHGFPDNLKGKDIPMGARIIAIADFAEKTLKRYMDDRGVKITMNIVKDKLNNFFDPQLL